MSNTNRIAVAFVALLVATVVYAATVQVERMPALFKSTVEITGALTQTGAATLASTLGVTGVTTHTGATALNQPAKTVRFRLPANTRRYVRIAQTATATPGTLAQSMVAKLLF